MAEKLLSPISRCVFTYGMFLLFSSGDEHVWWPGHGLCARKGKEM